MNRFFYHINFLNIKVFKKAHNLTHYQFVNIASIFDKGVSILGERDC